jgi:sigma-E factor negative regulatory protein RseA
MSKESLEHLSSLMDGEVSRDSSMFLTRRLASDDALCNTWERYHLIRDCIRQPGGKIVVTQLSATISASIEAEHAPVVNTWQNNRWLKPVSGLAIAASVAMMAIVVSTPQPTGLPGAAGDAVLTGTPNQQFVSPNTLPIKTLSQPVSFAASQKTEVTRLNAYLLRHNRMAGSAGRQGFVSFVPIVVAQAPAGAEESAIRKDDTDPDAASIDSRQEAAVDK